MVIITAETPREPTGRENEGRSLEELVDRVQQGPHPEMPASLSTTPLHVAAGAALQVMRSRR